MAKRRKARRKPEVDVTLIDKATTWSPALYEVHQDRVLLGFLEKYRDSKYETHPWKAMVPAFVGGRRPMVGDMIGVFYAHEGGKQAAIKALLAQSNLANPGPYAAGITELLGALRPGDRFGWVRVSEVGKRLGVDNVELNYFLDEAEQNGLVESRAKGKTTEHRLTSKGAGAYAMTVILPEEIVYESEKHEALVEVLYGADVIKGGEVTPIIMVTDLGGRKRPGWSVYFPQTRGTIHRAIDGMGYDQGQGWTAGVY